MAIISICINEIYIIIRLEHVFSYLEKKGSVLLYMIPTHQETVSFHISFFMLLVRCDCTSLLSFLSSWALFSSEIQVDLTCGTISEPFRFPSNCKIL
jgi:hypothetical protein